jgi:hypothetical protein
MNAGMRRRYSSTLLLVLCIKKKNQNRRRKLYRILAWVNRVDSVVSDSLFALRWWIESILTTVLLLQYYSTSMFLATVRIIVATFSSIFLAVVPVVALSPLLQFISHNHYSLPLLLLLLWVGFIQSTPYPPTYLFAVPSHCNSVFLLLLDWLGDRWTDMDGVSELVKSWQHLIIVHMRCSMHAPLLQFILLVSSLALSLSLSLTSGRFIQHPHSSFPLQFINSYLLLD